MSKLFARSAIMAVAFVTGLTGAAQAAPLNLGFAPQGVETAKVELVHSRRSSRGAAVAIGAIGAIAAGAAIAASRDRYYRCDPYYDYCGPRPVYRDYRYRDYGYRDYRYRDGYRNRAYRNRNNDEYGYYSNGPRYRYRD